MRLLVTDWRCSGTCRVFLGNSKTADKDKNTFFWYVLVRCAWWVVANAIPTTLLLAGSRLGHPRDGYIPPSKPRLGFGRFHAALLRTPRQTFSATPFHAAQPHTPRQMFTCHILAHSRHGGGVVVCVFFIDPTLHF